MFTLPFRGCQKGRSPLLALLLVFVAPAALLAQSDVRKPSLDNGRFWIYRNAAPLVFLPYGMMPEELLKKDTPTRKHVVMDLECADHPFLEPGRPPAPATEDGKPGETCISLKVNWASPYWCAVAFIAGPDAPPWWGETDQGTHFDLSSLPKKHLVAYVRGATGRERIKLQVGILTRPGKKFGDTLPFPAETRWTSLSKEWKRVEIDLSRFKPQELSAITNGLTIALSQVQQGDPSELSTTVYLDQIYFE